MKFINVFLLCLGLVTIISCKTEASDVSDTLLTTNSWSVNDILLGTARDEKGNVVVCKFECDNDLRYDSNANQNKELKCGKITPKYMKIEFFKYKLSDRGYENIDFAITSDANKLLKKEISEDQLDYINDVFDHNPGNSSIAHGVCDPVLKSEKNSDMMLIGLKIKEDSDEWRMDESEIQKIKKQIGLERKNPPSFKKVSEKNIYFDTITEKSWMNVKRQVKDSEAAARECSRLARNTGEKWRLPYVLELYAAYIDGAYLYSQPVGAWVWSSTYAESGSGMSKISLSKRWIMDLSTGNIKSIPISENRNYYGVWCVKTHPNNE